MIIFVRWTLFRGLSYLAILCVFETIALNHGHATIDVDGLAGDVI